MFNTLCRFVTKTTTEGLSLFPFVIFHRLVYLWRRRSMQWLLATGLLATNAIDLWKMQKEKEMSFCRLFFV